MQKGARSQHKETPFDSNCKLPWRNCLGKERKEQNVLVLVGIVPTLGVDGLHRVLSGPVSGSGVVLEIPVNLGFISYVVKIQESELAACQAFCSVTKKTKALKTQALFLALPACGGMVNSLGSSLPWCGSVRWVALKLASCAPPQHTTTVQAS